MSDGPAGAVVECGEVRMPYERACREYVFGLSAPFAWSALACGHAALFLGLGAARPFFAAFTAATAALVAASYVAPVVVYETLEGEP
jgi:hypothetical protein